MRDHCFVARQRLVMIAPRVSQYGLAGRVSVVSTKIKISGHMLRGSSRGVVERKNTVDPRGIIAFLFIRVADSKSERAVLVLAVPEVTQIDFEFACKKELMRHREHSERTVRFLGNRQSIARAQHNGISR